MLQLELLSRKIQRRFAQAQEELSSATTLHSLHRFIISAVLIFMRSDIYAR